MLFKALQEETQRRSGTTVGGSGFFDLFGRTYRDGSGGITFSNPTRGAVVNNNTVFQLSGFYRGINLICNDYAKLPKHVVREVDGRIDHLPNHPVDVLINDRPNQYMNAFGFDSILLKCAIIKGNGYAEKVVNEFTGVVESLQYIDENDTPVTVKKFENRLFYHFDGRVLPSDRVIHYRSLFSDNGITGIGIVTFAAKSLGVALTSQEFAEDYYASKGIGTGVVTTPKDMDSKAKERYGNALSNTLSNANPFKVAVVDEGGSFHHIKLTPQESMFLETSKHAIYDIANFLGLPVYKLGITENQNNSNMEHQSISHVSDSILPWALINQQEYNAKIFTRSERLQGIKTFFDTDSLLQADKKTQSEYYKNLVYASVITPNKAAQKLGFPSIDGADDRLIPVNMQTQKQIDKQLKLNGYDG